MGALNEGLRAHRRVFGSSAVLFLEIHIQTFCNKYSERRIDILGNLALERGYGPDAGDLYPFYACYRTTGTKCASTLPSDSGA